MAPNECIPRRKRTESSPGCVLNGVKSGMYASYVCPVRYREPDWATRGCMYSSPPALTQPEKGALRVSVTKMSLQGVFETMAGQGDSDLVRQSQARGGRRPL